MPVVADAPVEDDPVEVGQVSDELVVAAAERMPHDLRAPQGAGLGADRVTGVRERVVEVRDVVGQPRRLGELGDELGLAGVVAGRHFQDVDALPV